MLMSLFQKPVSGVFYWLCASVCEQMITYLQTRSSVFGATLLKVIFSNLTWNLLKKHTAKTVKSFMKSVSFDCMLISHWLLLQQQISQSASEKWSLTSRPVEQRETPAAPLLVFAFVLCWVISLKLCDWNCILSVLSSPVHWVIVSDIYNLLVH